MKISRLLIIGLLVVIVASSGFAIGSIYGAHRVYIQLQLSRLHTDVLTAEMMERIGVDGPARELVERQLDNSFISVVTFREQRVNMIRREDQYDDVVRAAIVYRKRVRSEHLERHFKLTGSVYLKRLREDD